jgi:hypothetical protein
MMHEPRDPAGRYPFGDEEGDTKWMTYVELGQARGINIASAKHLAYRRKWRRQPGNDGTTRVAVPIVEAHRRTGTEPSTRNGMTPMLSDLEAALSLLREQLERERRRADQATEAAERSAARLAESEARVAKLQSAAHTAALLQDALERALSAEEVARRQADAKLVLERAVTISAQAEAEALRQADRTRRTLSRLARVRAAWAK